VKDTFIVTHTTDTCEEVYTALINYHDCLELHLQHTDASGTFTTNFGLESFRNQLTKIGCIHAFDAWIERNMQYLRRQTTLLGANS